MESKVSEGSVGPGRGCKEKHHIGRGSQAKELTCLASPPLAQLTLLMTRPRELDGTGDMGGSGLGASEGCGSGSELTGASTAGHWAPAGSSRGSGEALVGELWGEAGELGLPQAGPSAGVSLWSHPGWCPLGLGLARVLLSAVPAALALAPAEDTQDATKVSLTLNATPTHRGPS